MDKARCYTIARLRDKLLELADLSTVDRCLALDSLKGALCGDVCNVRCDLGVQQLLAHGRAIGEIP